MHDDAFNVILWTSALRDNLVWKNRTTHKVLESCSVLSWSHSIVFTLMLVFFECFAVLLLHFIRSIFILLSYFLLCIPCLSCSGSFFCICQLIGYKDSSDDTCGELRISTQTRLKNMYFLFICVTMSLSPPLNDILEMCLTWSSLVVWGFLLKKVGSFFSSKSDIFSFHFFVFFI